MSRYTDADIRDMALLAIQARDLGDPRYVFLVINLALRFGITPAQADAEVQRLATA